MLLLYTTQLLEVAICWDERHERHDKILLTQSKLVQNIDLITQSIVEGFKASNQLVVKQTLLTSFVDDAELVQLIDLIYDQIQSCYELFLQSGEVTEFRFGTGRSLMIWKDSLQKDNPTRSLTNVMQSILKGEVDNAHKGIWDFLLKEAGYQPEFL